MRTPDMQAQIQRLYGNRAGAMRTLYCAEGWTLQEIGDRYGISRERVRQILHDRYGITAKDSREAQARRREREHNVKLDELEQDVLDTYRRYATFQQTAEVLDLDAEVVSEIVRLRMDEAERKEIDSRWRIARRTPNTELVGYLQAVADSLGKQPGDPLSIKEYDSNKEDWMPGSQTMRKHLGELGGWAEVVETAGYTTSGPATGHRKDRRWTRETCLQQVRFAVKIIGHFPSVLEYEKLRSNGNPGLPSQASIRTRVGTWRDLERALQKEPA